MLDARRRDGGGLSQDSAGAVRRVRAAWLAADLRRPLVESGVGVLGRRARDDAAGERAHGSTAICYEVVYPHLIREAVRQGSELLTTITNDAWYGESSAPYQHFELARMRAIEQGRYLARAANTGISGIVDPYGRVVARTALFETTAVVGEVRFLQGARSMPQLEICRRNWPCC